MNADNVVAEVDGVLADDRTPAGRSLSAVQLPHHGVRGVGLPVGRNGVVGVIDVSVVVACIAEVEPPVVVELEDDGVFDVVCPSFVQSDAPSGNELSSPVYSHV